MADIEDRVGRLERTLARLGGGAIVGGVALLAFFGTTSFYHIPNAIKTYVETELPGFEKRLRDFLADAEESVGQLQEHADQGKEHADQLQDWAEAWRSSGVPVKMQTGLLVIHKSDMPDLWDVPAGHCPEGIAGQRGELEGRVDFQEPFHSPPTVLIAFSALDFAHDRNIRIRVRAEKVDKEGFDYVLATWCNTRVWKTQASWIAIANRLDELEGT